MRSILAAILLIASAWCAHAGVLVELTDGTKLTVESHWTDGDQVHLVRGGVDMIVAKSKIKSMDEDVADPEVFWGGTGEGAKEGGEEPGAADAPAAADGTAGGGQEFEKPLAEMSADELEAMHEDESHRLLDLQDKRFNALYGGGATPEQQKAANEAFQKQNKRSAKIWFALEKAKGTEAGAAPAVPRVEQPQ